MAADNDDTGRFSCHHASSGRLGQVQGAPSPLVHLRSRRRSSQRRRFIAHPLPFSCSGNLEMDHSSVPLRRPRNSVAQRWQHLGIRLPSSGSTVPGPNNAPGIEASRPAGVFLPAELCPPPQQSENSPSATRDGTWIQCCTSTREKQKHTHYWTGSVSRHIETTSTTVSPARASRNTSMP